MGSQTSRIVSTLNGRDAKAPKSTREVAILDSGPGNSELGIDDFTTSSVRDDSVNKVYLSQGQPKQWLQLGCKALDANDNKKAAMLLNMSLYLSDSSTEKSILSQLYHALAEAHFNLNEHKRSIDAGEEFFTLRPIKSEVIALVFIVITSTTVMRIIKKTVKMTTMYDHLNDDDE